MKLLSKSNKQKQNNLISSLRLSSFGLGSVFKLLLGDVTIFVSIYITKHFFKGTFNLGSRKFTIISSSNSLKVGGVLGFLSLDCAVETVAKPKLNTIANNPIFTFVVFIILIFKFTLMTSKVRNSSMQKSDFQ